MSQQFTVDLDDQLAEALNKWMAANNVTDRSQVFERTLKSYISTNLAASQSPTQALSQNTVKNATKAELDEHLPELMKDHKEALDLLKKPRRGKQKVT